MALTFRWLGAAGLELALEGFTLLIDPFFTRPGKLAVLAARRVAPDEALSARLAPRADALLVTHPHYDHLMDVPEIARRTGAPVFASPNGCALVASRGVPAEQVRVIAPGSRLRLGPFSVEVLPGWHTPIPLEGLFSGPVPRRVLADPRPPRLKNYRMDACFSFRVRAGGQSLLVGSHPARADALFLSPFLPERMLAALLQSVQPAQVIPIHWDDFMRPLSLPLRPMLVTPAQAGRFFFPPLRRMDVQALLRAVRAVLPQADARLPGLLRLEELG